MTISFCIVIYLFIMGSILIEDSSLVITVESATRKILKYGVCLHQKRVGSNYHIEVTKDFPGRQTKHIEVTANSLLDGLLKIIEEIERDLESWIEKVLY